MERLTKKRVNGIKEGYWSVANKQELVNRLAAYENTGLDPDKIREMDELYLEKCKEVDKMKRSGQQSEDNEMDKLITEMAEYICDKRCEIPNEIGRTQEEVDEICSECRMGEFIRKIQDIYKPEEQTQSEGIPEHPRWLGNFKREFEHVL